VNRSIALLLTLSCLAVVAVVGIRVVLLFRAIKKQREQVRSSHVSTPSCQCVCNALLLTVAVCSCGLTATISSLENTQMMGSIGRDVTDNDRQMDHQMKVILTSTLFFIIVLLATAIEGAIMFASVFENNLTLTWQTFRNRLVIDTLVILSLYIVLLICHRYNRYALCVLSTRPFRVFLCTVL
jgi:hypothetical protein